MGLGEQLMKLVVKVEDAVALAVHFEASPAEAMKELVKHVQQGAKEVLERVMDAEIGIFLGRDGDPTIPPPAPSSHPYANVGEENKNGGNR